jgi:hypothetical protein
MSKKQMNAMCKELQELISVAVQAYENNVAEDYGNIDSELKQWLLKNKLIHSEQPSE